MAELTDQELLRMQDEAKKRVQEMQKRARLTYDTAQNQPPATESTPVLRPSAQTQTDGQLVSLLLRVLQPAQDPILDAMLGLLRSPAGQNDLHDRF